MPTPKNPEPQLEDETDIPVVTGDDDNPQPEVETSEEHVDEETDNPNREAAKWRTQLRATEAERDELRAALDVAHTEIVETIVADRITLGALEKLSGNTVTDFFDDGILDRDRLDKAIDAALDEANMIARANTPFPDVGQGHRTRSATPTSWSTAIRGF